jgi:NADPH-dependent ferric siderophore reductase
VVGPGAGHTLEPTLLAGDESAVPAIRTLCRPGVRAVVEVADAAGEDPALPGATWLHRSRGESLGAWFADFDDPDATVWLAGEHGAVRAIRRRLRAEVGLPRERSVAVPYWRAARDSDQVDAEIADAMAAATVPLETTQDVVEAYLDR